MLRLSITLVLMALVLPTAAAGPTASLKVGPGPDDRGNEPYYLWINATQPEAPRNAQGNDDCAAGRPAPPPDRAAKDLADPILAWDPLAEPRLSGWFPRCIATDIGGSDGADTGTRVSYDVTTGRYYIDAPATAVAALPVEIGGRAALSSAALTGTTGVSVVTDCEGCPPPGLI